MKTDWSHLDRYRTKHGQFASELGVTYGRFVAPSDKSILNIIAADGVETSWEHVSVSAYEKRKGGLRPYIPTWEEMHQVKRMFWEDSETVIQLHPPQTNYISRCQNCLHLWRPTTLEIPLPPTILV